MIFVPKGVLNRNVPKNSPNLDLSMFRKVDFYIQNSHYRNI